MKPIAKLAQRYPGKRVLITGATSGLGEALALRFAEVGFRVGIAGRSSLKVAASAEKVRHAGGAPLEIPLEVTRTEDFAAARLQVEEAWGGLDILINNAGIASSGAIGECDLVSWRRVLDTNLWSVIHGCRSFLPLLYQAGGGHVVNVASAAGLLCAPGMATYNVSKAGVIALSETLATELKEGNIHTTVSCPSVFKSSLIETSLREMNGGMAGVTGAGLKSSMAGTRISSDDVARSIIRSMARRRLYNVPMRDARAGWRAVRFLPEIARKAMHWLFARRLWIFADSQDH